MLVSNTGEKHQKSHHCQKQENILLCGYAFQVFLGKQAFEVAEVSSGQDKESDQGEGEAGYEKRWGHKGDFKRSRGKKLDDEKKNYAEECGG